MKLSVTHKVKQRHRNTQTKILVATTVDSHVVILSIAKKILELTSKKSRLPINNCLAYLVNYNTTLNEYMLDTLNKFETYYNTTQAFLKLMGSDSNPKLPSI